MKKTLAMILAIVMILSFIPAAMADGELAGTYDITVWVAEKAVDLTKAQIDAYNQTNQLGITFNATIEIVGESDSATNMITDVEAGADIYCFAQDQFARLVQAGALAKLGQGAAAKVAEANDPAVVAAATTGDTLYAYPLTSDNGYFMYYDKTVIPEEDIGSLEAIIADCEAAGKYFSMETDTSAWYIASFFFATGCVSNWTTDADGKFISVEDTFNSANGVIAAQGLYKLQSAPCHVSSSAGSDFDANSAVVVTGTWDFETVKAILGDNMGVAALPSFEVDGTSYHMGSFNGCKLLGVKPQVDAVRQAALHQLAQYLTSYDCQMERFNTLSWGPANSEAQASEAVQANPGLAALLAQSPYSKPQGQIHGMWWDIAKVIGTEVGESDGSAEGVKVALENYYNSISALFSIDTSGLILVGAWCGWNNAADDYRMAEDNGVYTITITVEQSDYMGGRIVTPADWDTDKGAAQVTTGADLIDVEAGGGDNNIVFVAPGTYTVTYDSNSGEITIVAA